MASAGNGGDWSHGRSRVVGEAGWVAEWERARPKRITVGEGKTAGGLVGERQCVE